MANVHEQIQKLKAQAESLEQLINLGELYQKENNRLDARHYFQEAIDKYPNAPDGYYHLGLWAYQSGDYEFANNNLSQAASLDSANSDIWLAWAKTHLKLQGLGRAEEYIDKALSLDQKPEILLYAGIIKLKLHNIYYAEKYLKEVLDKPECELSAYAKFYYALLKIQQTYYNKAAELLQSILETKEFKDVNSVNGISARNNLALAETRLKNYEKAEKLLNEILKGKAKDSAKIWLNLAMVYWQQDKIKEAVEALEKVNSIDPNLWPWIDETKEYVKDPKEWMKNKAANLKKESEKSGIDLGLYLGCVIPNRYPFIEAATRHTFDLLDIGLADLEGASCCPAPGVFRSFDIPTWEAVAARNITLSEELNRDLVTMCNGCYGTLNDVNTELHEDKNKIVEVNQVLSEIGKEYKGSSKVRHVMDVLYFDIGVNKLRKMVKNPVNIKVAIHYGCHILKPSYNKPWDPKDLENPHFFEEIVSALGATPVEYRDKLMCCGAGGAVRSGAKEVSLDFTREKLENMRAAGVDAIVLCCPFCHLQFDLGQMEVNNIFKDKVEEPFSFPVIYITQLLGWALGLDPFRSGLLETPTIKGTPPFIPVENVFTKVENETELP